MFIILYGSEPFLAEQKLKEIIENYKKTQKSGLNLTFLKAEDFSFDDFKSSLGTVSMFEEKKLIVIKNIFSKNNDEAKNILKLVKDLDIQDSKDVVVVFFESDIPKKNKYFESLLKKPNLFQEFQKLEGVKLNNWIKQEFEKLGSQADPKAITVLIKSVGTDMYRLKNEIDKLAAYKKTIAENDILDMVSAEFHSDIFSVIDAISKKDKKLSFKILNDHIEHGESEIYLLTMIIYQFRNLLRVKSLLDQGVAIDQVAKKTGLHPFVAKKSISAARLFSLEYLKKIYQKLFDLDLKMKVGSIDPTQALNLFIAEL